MIGEDAEECHVVKCRKPAAGTHDIRRIAPGAAFVDAEPVRGVDRETAVADIAEERLDDAELWCPDVQRRIHDRGHAVPVVSHRHVDFQIRVC